MRTTRILTLCAVIAFLPFAWAADQYPPGKMTFQGFLTDASAGGAPLASAAPANFTITFKIYNAVTGGIVLWAEEQVVTVDKGHFSVLLGEGGPVTGAESLHRNSLAHLFIGSDASDRFIGITLQGQTEIAPRIQFFGAPYAQSARAAHTLVSANGSTLLSVDSAGIAALSSGINVSGPIVATSFQSSGSITTSGGVTANGVIWGGSGMRITGANVLELGYNVAGKEGNAGRIGYQSLSPNALDIVGAGTSGSNRRIKLWGEGGVEVAGSLSASAISTPTLSFGNTVGNTKLALWENGGPGYGFGIQSAQFRLHLDTPAARFSFLNAPAGAELMTITGAGKVGLGTTSPGTKLQVHGGSFDQLYLSNPNNKGWHIYSNDYLDSGDLIFYRATAGNAEVLWGQISRANGQYGIGSDRRLKKDIVPMEGLLASVLQLRPVSYRFKPQEDNSRKSLGFIAQEVEPLFPEVVSEGPGGMKTLAYSDLVPVAIGAVRELHQVVQEQKSEIEQLKQSVAELQKLVKTIAQSNQAAGQ